MKSPCLYWQRFAPKGGLPVVFPALREEAQCYRWTGIYGIQIGPWFFGAVRGSKDDTPPPALKPTESP